MVSRRITLLAPLWILLHVLPACLVLGADGQWGEWTEWESCSVSCGKGRNTRYRFCDSPSPSNGGKWCPGKPRDVRECEAPLRCSVNGGWSDWSMWTACSVSCGEGIMNRLRECDSPAPSNGGRDCDGSSQETMQCFAMKDCPRDGKWSKWSQWSACSVTCGSDGNSFRYRSCNNPAPRAGGRQCEGSSQQTRKCRAGEKCPVNGQWSEWTEWTSCSVTCGSGVRTRWRKCDNPPPQNGGLDCSRDDAGEMQERSCNGSVAFCAVNGGWSQWSNWGDCHTPDCKARERKAYQFRERTCSNPYPAHKGSMCQGTFLSAGFCEEPINCEVNGQWGDWSEWDCTAFVGIRRRTCDKPPPSNGGKPCKGADSEQINFEEDTFPEACPEFVGKADEGDDEDVVQAGSGSGDKSDDEE